MRYFLLFICIGSTFLSVSAQNDINKEKIFYSEVVLYGNDEDLDEAKIQKHIKKLIPEAEFATQIPKNVDKPIVLTKKLTDVKKEYPVIDLQYLKSYTVGLSEKEMRELRKVDNAVVCVLYGTTSRAFELNTAFYKAMYKSAKDDDIFIYDGITLTYMKHDMWKKKKLDGWENGIPTSFEHVIVYTVRKGAYCRSVSYGMQRFGLPDIVAEEVPCSDNVPMMNLINAVTQRMLEGKQFDENSMTIHIDSIRSERVKNYLLPKLFDNAKRTTTLYFKNANRLQNDPNNYLLQLDFESSAYPNAQAYQNATLTELFGVKDTYTSVTHSEALLAASERAKKRLPDLQKRFNYGLDTGEHIMVKAPFKKDQGGNEWMWVEVTQWDSDGTITGILQNQPYHVKALKAGMQVTVSQADIFDYILYKPDGTKEGNETGKIIKQKGN